MKKHAVVEEISPLFHGYKQTRYVPNVEPDMSELNGTDIAELEYVIARYGDMTGSQLTDHSHADGPWEYTDNLGDEIDYMMVHYRNPLYAVTEFVDEGD